jgi:hypothetical protein
MAEDHLGLSIQPKDGTREENNHTKSLILDPLGIIRINDPIVQMRLQLEMDQTGTRIKNPLEGVSSAENQIILLTLVP